MAGHARPGVERQGPLGYQVGRHLDGVVGDLPRHESRGRGHGRATDRVAGGRRVVAHSATELHKPEACAMVLRSGPGNRAEWALMR